MLRSSSIGWSAWIAQPIPWPMSDIFLLQQMSYNQIVPQVEDPCLQANPVADKHPVLLSKKIRRTTILHI